MLDTAEFPQETTLGRPYAAWAKKPASLPGFIQRRASGTMIRFQSGGLGNMAVIVCALSIAGLAAIAIMTLH
jgi:hypothetical protein